MPTREKIEHALAGARPTVSVVVPAYQAAETVGDALASVQAQTYADWETIVVDDGSSDGTAAVARDAAARLGIERCAVIERPRGVPGVVNNAAAARNAGIDAASGEVVAFLDADDIWYPEKLDRVMTALVDGGEALIGVCHDERLRDGDRDAGVIRYGTRLPLYWCLLLARNCLSTSATTVRRTALLDAGGFSTDPRFLSVEDYDLWLRLARRGRFAFIHEPLGEYRRHPQNLSGDIERHLRATLSVIDAGFDRQFGAERAELLRRQRRMRVIRHAAWACRARGDHRRAAGLARRAAREWPVSPKLWAVLCLVGADGLRRSGRSGAA